MRFHQSHDGVAASRRGKRFFFEKKEPKTFVLLGAPCGKVRDSRDKKVLPPFFQKAGFAFCNLQPVKPASFAADSRCEEPISDDTSIFVTLPDTNNSASPTVIAWLS